MSYRIRIAPLAAVIVAALALAPGALAGGGVTPDNRADRTGPAGLATQTAVTPDNRADRVGPAGLTAAQAPVSVDTAGLGLIHASSANAPGAAGRPASTTDDSFDWLAAAIGAAGAFAVTLAALGIGAGMRNRGRELAA